MARFCPIAPKPPPPPAPATGSSNGARKRGRQEGYYILPPHHLPAPVWWPDGVGSTAWGRKGKGQFVASIIRRPLPPVPTSDEHLVRLSLAVPGTLPSPDGNKRVIPVERDLLSKLQVRNKVITPHPARPLRTTICIDSSNIVVGPKSAAVAVFNNKTDKEVEAEVEQDARPAIVSGCHNRVFLVNDAYKAMVGQPVCTWLDSLPGAGASRRINGEVVLNIQTFSPASRLPNAGGAFPCTARISWELDGAMASLTVPCAVERLTGDSSGDYRSIWRFDSTRASIIYCLS
ncbi:hypothetical protein PR202_ga28306 [Eleusine coracana subsp. coracana]|uniref:DUF7950 domain-containing protein n=1 Tax=Eleusine coracana subsp. coracana TaxID=191504 RepID=A0AAV5DH13_ELECO|nr:hypothetical protein PR202_ga28306 [Eleusine coracana subsp. coracana]